jgi:hypothetical protein
MLNLQFYVQLMRLERTVHYYVMRQLVTTLVLQSVSTNSDSSLILGRVASLAVMVAQLRRALHSLAVDPKQYSLHSFGLVAPLQQPPHRIWTGGEAAQNDSFAHCSGATVAPPCVRDVRCCSQTAHARDLHCAVCTRVICTQFRRLTINVRIINAQHQLLNVVSQFNRQ